MSFTGSSFTAPAVAPLRTPFEMKHEDEKFARAVISAKVGVDYLEVSAPLARKVAEQQVATAEQRYLRAPESALAGVAKVTGHSKSDLLPFFRRAAEEGRLVRFDGQFGLEFTPNSLTLVTFAR